MGLIFDIEKLLKPYENGGTKESPVKRTIATLSTKLLYQYKFSPDIVGKALFQTFFDMAHHGLEFKGDGTYDSNGTELFTHIRNLCIELSKDAAVRSITETILGELTCTKKDCPKRTKELSRLSKWQRFWMFVNKPRGFWRL